ncbi:hypothetical protein PtrSN001A_011856, partial [Pyrenophora tritici-repentis]
MNAAFPPEFHGFSEEGDSGMPTTWSLDILVKRAQAEIPDYHEVTASHDIRFAGPFGDAQIPNRKHIIPAEASEMMLIVGSYVHESNASETIVYAFVYGVNANQIGFMYMDEQGKAERLDVCRCKEINFQTPFCYLGDNDLGQQSVRLMLRPFLLFNFLSANYLDTITHYKSFWTDLTKAFSWIANKGRRPDTGLSKPKTSAKAANPKSMLHEYFAEDSTSKPQAVASKLEEDEDPVQPRIKRRDYGGSSTIQNPQSVPVSPSTPEEPPVTHDHEAGLQALASQHEKEVTRLRNELDAMRQRSDLVHNAYNGLKRNHDQLSIAYSKAVKDIHQVRARYLESSESSKRWKTRAEDAEKRETTLKAQRREDRAKMARARQLLETSESDDEAE